MKVVIPPASAKRLEQNRHVLIKAINIFGTTSKFIAIPNGVSEFEFDFEEYHNPNADYMLDADISYRYFILYQNATGSRQETIEFKPTK